MNNRRKVVIALGASGAAFGLPPSSLAQAPGKIWRIGFLVGRRLEGAESDPITGAFRLGMRELGYVEGKSLVIEWRGASGRMENLPRLAEELVALKVDLIVASGTASIAAAQKASSTIPIVMASANDPISAGFVKTLARPGGNITGLSNMSGDLGGKQLELLRSMVPKLSSVSVLSNPANASMDLLLKGVHAAAQKTGLKVLRQEVTKPEQIEMAFLQINAQKAGAVIVPLDSIFNPRWQQIVDLTRKYRLPAMFASSEAVERGGLMSYGQDIRENYRRAAIYVDKIVKGAKPGELPVEQPTKLELTINGKTTKALGLTIPQALLISVERVIE